MVNKGRKEMEDNKSKKRLLQRLNVENERNPKKPKYLPPNYFFIVNQMPEVLINMFMYLEVNDFDLASVCKTWSEVFREIAFYKAWSKVHWGVNFSAEVLKENRIKNYIFERYNLENVSLRLIKLTQSYRKTPDKATLQILRSLISQEEFITETRQNMANWIDGLQSLQEKQDFQKLLSRLLYEEYDKFVSQDGNGANFGEGWLGHYRIYDQKGSFVTVEFDCYCHSGRHTESEHLKLGFRVSSAFGKKVIISADAHTDESRYVYESSSLEFLKEFFQLEYISLTNLFCFMLIAMGPLTDFYKFRSLGTDAFSEFWSTLEKK
eukprot:TRINITY_DN14205_c0_g1_i1.p1 TRINITY_DN14205_c0_g1~~TRINITY_DN14205_c0_g1_i1.p1  ORF type:complete len:322 (+),score=54.06 TRINITY_DN14205_c0_g1_i1:53-1018(+)